MRRHAARFSSGASAAAGLAVGAVCASSGSVMSLHGLAAHAAPALLKVKISGERTPSASLHCDSTLRACRQASVR
ncbi:hypothetical protein GCM10027321_42480 [Massilia terrae]